MTNIISIVSNKGGNGKTTTTLNLAGALNERGLKVLLIDADPQSNLSTVFGLTNKSENIKSLGHILLDLININDAILHNNEMDLDIITASNQMYDLESVIFSKEFSYDFLNERLAQLKIKYDFILIDNAPSLGTFFTNSLVASNYILIPVVAEFFSYEGLEKLHSHYLKIKQKVNPNLDLLGLLINNDSKNGRTIIGKTIKQEIRNAFPSKIFKTELGSYISIIESQNDGKNVFKYAPNSKVTDQYRELAKEVLSKVIK